MGTPFRQMISKAYNSLPRDMIWALNCRRFARDWRAANAIFIHVPKAAGTGISTALYGRHLGHLKAADIQRAIPDDFQKLFKFAFLRNPWDRIYSSYHFVRQGGTSDVKVSAPERFQVPEFGTFERFVLEWLPGKDLLDQAYVFMPQSAFVLDAEGKLLVDFLGYVENFNEGVAEVNKHLGLDLKIPVTNEVKKAISYRDAYTPEMRNMIASLYGKDIEIGNYDF